MDATTTTGTRGGRAPPDAPTRSPSAHTRSSARSARSSSARRSSSGCTLVGLLANSHVLLEGVPGLGKTMLVRTIADVIDCSFNRIQFTPDLMPADITGTNILIEEGGSRVFRFQTGPDLREPRARRRDQPRHAEDPELAARGDAGAPGHGRPQPLPARPAVLRARDAEPARDGGHVPPARGAAGPVPAQGHGPVPVRGGPGRDHRADDRRRCPEGRQGRERRRDRRDAAARARGPDRAAHHRLRGLAAGGDATPTRAARRRSSASTSATAARRAARRRWSRRARSWR